MNRLNSTVAVRGFGPPSRRRKPAVAMTLTAGGHRCAALVGLRLGTRRRMSPSGLGLVEVICSTLIVGIMLVASLETVGAVFRTQRLNADRLAGPNLAMELMTEVLSMAYEDPDIENSDIGNTEDE
jgi:hypothetical protein